MTKFDLDTLKSLCKSMFDYWRKAAKTETNNGKVITVDQLTYCEKKTLTSLDGVLPFVGPSPKLITTYIEFGLVKFKPSMFLSTYLL